MTLISGFPQHSYISVKPRAEQVRDLILIRLLIYIMCVILDASFVGITFIVSLIRNGGCHGRDHIVVGFITTYKMYAISAYHH